MRPSRLAAVAAVVITASTLAPLTTSGSVGASAADPVIRPLESFRPTGAKVRVRPTAYRAYRVDTGAVRQQLAAAPDVGSASGVVVDVPTPRGGVERFTVQRTAILAPRLAAEHPEIVTAAGRSLEHRGTTIALDVTPMGLHAAVRGPNGQGSWYVDPAYDRRGTREHLAYRTSALPRTEEFVEREAPRVLDRARPAPARTAPDRVVTQRLYRVAMLSDPSYAEYFGTENVLAEKATLMARVNQLYNQDLAIQLQLINETPRLNLDTEAEATGVNGPCGAHPCFDPPVGDPEDEENYVPGQLEFCDVPTLGRQRTVLGQLVGAANYDLGHLVLGTNGGGVAFFGVGADYKGGGCTGIPEPRGDYFAIDYVAHEMGHQFYANHTFNGDRWNCFGGQRNGTTSVEPGSGSSIMAYAGICREDNLQPHSDPYFSAASMDEVSAWTEADAQVVEVQTVSLYGFDTNGETITLGSGSGSGTPQTLTRGSTYNRAGIEAAVETLTGRDVTIAGWGYDPFNSPTLEPAPLTDPDDTGFQVIYSPSPDPDTPTGPFVDVPGLTVTSTSPGVSGYHGTTAQGGPAGNGGYDTRTTTNRAPRVTRRTTPQVIPVRTPFVLSGAGRDVDGDRLTYLWEQMDTGPAQRGTALVDNDKVYGPLFRVFGTAADVSDEDALESPAPGQNQATGNPTRYFPDLAQVLRGNTNAATGRCPRVPLPDEDTEDYYKPVKPPVVSCFSEFLPTARYRGTPGGPARTMHFRLTARDGRGGVSYARTTVRVVPTAGPFRVVSQARRAAVRRGGPLTVRWQVNGTRRLSPRVTVLLSTNGGRSFRVLAAATPNDGTARVRLPRAARTGNARVMVKARTGVFYAVNRVGFRIR